MEDGGFVGFLLGVEDGGFVGFLLGVADGDPDGFRVGDVVGALKVDGANVGVKVVGLGVGFGVGGAVIGIGVVNGVGRLLGCWVPLLGDRVGDDDGDGVGPYVSVGDGVASCDGA